MRQHTIKQIIRTTGIGLHTGTRSKIEVLPAAPDTGIVFIKSSKNKITIIPATSRHVTSTVLSTDIGRDGETIRTIEHLMSAFCGCGIDNAYVNITGDEIPAMDGSAAPFCFLIKEAGVVAQSSFRRFLRIDKPVKVRDGMGWAELLPHPGFALDFSIEFDNPVIGKSRYSIDCLTQNYWTEISRARTFGFIKDTAKLHESGAALGANMSNAIVLSDYSVLNQEGLRYPDEFVRHKILDAIGDLYVSGYQIIGKYRAHASGHRINNLLLEAAFSKGAVSIVQSPRFESSFLFDYLKPDSTYIPKTS